MDNVMTEIISGVFSDYSFSDSNPWNHRRFKINDSEGVSVYDWVIVSSGYTTDAGWDNDTSYSYSIYSTKQMFYREWLDGTTEPNTWIECPHETTAYGERWLAGDFSYYQNIGLTPVDYMEVFTYGFEMSDSDGCGIQGVPVYDQFASPNKPAGYAWLLNPDTDDITNLDDILKYQRCTRWVLYLDSGSYYLTWDSPYIEMTAGSNGVFPYDATIELKATFLNNYGPDNTSEFTCEYTAEPYQFTYQKLLNMVQPNKIAQWLGKIIDSTEFIDSGDLKLEFRTFWKETDPGSGSTSTYETDWMTVIFDPKNLITTLIKHKGDAIKSYSATADDGSTLTIKDGLPQDDPDYKSADWDGIKYSTDSDYVDPSTSSDTWSDEAEYSTLNSLTKTYAMTPGRLDALGSFLWGTNFYSIIHSVNSCPIENIVGLYAFPFDMTGTDEEIYLGNAATGVRGAKVSNSYNPKINVGSIDISGLYDSFLDYGPYTKLYIFLPFLGLKELDIARCIGKTLKLEYVPDLVTGVAAANIFIDGKLEYTYSCQMGIQIPLNATNAGQVTAGVVSNLATTAVVAAASIATENYIGAIGAIAGGGVAAATAKVSTETSGASSPNCWSKMPRTAFLLYDRPTYQELAMFNHTYGRMCNLSKQLGSLKGFTQISNIDLSGVQIATKQEADEIRELLKEGVWL
jgi:hypothetical protein